MRLSASIHSARVPRGYLLVECLVYLAVFVVIVGLGLATFYLCWDNSKALRYGADEITAALHAGECWRADVRAATGEITIENTAGGELLRIPCGTNEVFYRYNSGEIRRQSEPSDFAEPMLTAVQASQMTMDRRGPINAWRWELELKWRSREIQPPLRFTFEAAVKTTP